MRSRAVRALALLQSQQTLQQAAAHHLGQVAALHSLAGTPAITAQEQAVLQAGRQESNQYGAPSQRQGYGAAALAEQPQWPNSPQQHSPQRHVQQSRHVQERWQAAAEVKAFAQDMQPFVVQQATAGSDSLRSHFSARSSSSVASSSSSSTTDRNSIAAATAAAAPQLPGDGRQAEELIYGVTDVFMLSNPQEQYRLTLSALHSGQSKNLDQLAHMFDPQALLAAPDKGAGVLEALMFAAAKLEDLQLLRQLLRCMGAANHTLSSRGHRAVLHGLASCGRPVEALEWLQRMPEHQLHPQLVRSLVQQLLRTQHAQAAQRVLDYAEPKLMQRWRQQLQSVQEPAAAANATAAGESSAAHAEQVHRLSLQDMQELPSLRLAIAGHTEQLSVLHEEWTRIKRQAQEVQRWCAGQHTDCATITTTSSSSPGVQRQRQGNTQLDLLGAYVWANYTLALSRIARSRQSDRWEKQQARRRLQVAIEQTLDMYQAHAWASYADWQGAQQQCPVLSSPAPGAMVDTAVGQSPQWLLDQQQLAQNLWQQHCHGRSNLSWEVADPAAVLPQQIASAAVGGRQLRLVCQKALQAALLDAAGSQHEQQLQQLLQLGALLKFMPRAAGFEAMLDLKWRQGVPPEALEELLGEMMGWGVIPTVDAYETLLEAYASHMDIAPAEAILDRMQAAGLQPVMRSYNRLLHGVALNGDLTAAIRVYNRMKLQGLLPDIQTMRCLFKCVRMYASKVRVATARAISLQKPGDREALLRRMSERSGLFASAYSQLAMWQHDMVAAGLKHTDITMMHLTLALERLGAVEDCLQLAKLSEGTRPGDWTAHRAALRIAGRTRDVRAAGEVSKIAALMAQGGNLGRQEYLAIINSQFWLKQDHEQLLQTVAAMKAAGHDLNEHTLQQLLNVYCHNGMWGEALQVLNDVAAGRFTAASSTGSSISSHQISTGARRQDSNAVGEGSIDNDKLWHVVLRKLWEKRASDELLNEFLRHIAPAQLQRFKLLYGLHKIPGEQPGQPDRYSLRPLEDWQLPLQQQQRQQQQQDQLQELEQLEQEGQGYVQPPELQKLPDDTAFPAVGV